jgi:hypothetical protein
MADLIARLARDGRMRQIRDETYFAWRFRNPLCRYRFLFWNDGGLQGFAVAQWHVKRDGTELGLVDWATGDEEVLGGLLNTAIRVFEPETVTIWAATLAKGQRDMLWDLGFTEIDQPVGPGQYVPSALIAAIPKGDSVPSFVMDGRDLQDLANWDLRMIESDYY